jgi:hypothetical protein
MPLGRHALLMKIPSMKQILSRGVLFCMIMCMIMCMIKARLSTARASRASNHWPVAGHVGTIRALTCSILSVSIPLRRVAHVLWLFWFSRSHLDCLKQVTDAIANARAAQTVWCKSTFAQRKLLLNIFNKHILEAARAICEYVRLGSMRMYCLVVHAEVHAVCS